MEGDVRYDSEVVDAVERPLVVGADGSPGSLPALDWAAAEAARRGLPLRIVCASLFERYEAQLPSAGGEDLPEQMLAEHVAASAGQRVRQAAPGLDVHTEVLPAEPVDALVEESRRASLLVTGSSGRGAVRELLLGSVSLSVAGRAHCPVVVVRGTEENVRGDGRRVVVGVGREEEAPAAVEFAVAAAQLRGCEVEAVRAWRSPQQQADPLVVLDQAARAYAEQAAALLEDSLRAPLEHHPGVTVRRTVVEGPAHKALVRLSAGAALLVVGATRRHGLRGLQLGRVSHRALHHAPCPVAVVPHE
ncbi:universal stress protein [Streptomyces sp. NPDC049555]|uniref:universal stress protein n=1 Tax=unclassified Streptomyces TaxID=2593676 RepID=UPI00343F6331